MRCSGKKRCAVLQVKKQIHGRSQMGLVLDVFVSEDRGLKCIEIKMSSPSSVASTAWIRTEPWSYKMGTSIVRLRTRT